MVNTSHINYLAQFVIDNAGDDQPETVIAGVIGNLAQYLADFND